MRLCITQTTDTPNTDDKQSTTMPPFVIHPSWILKEGLLFCKLDLKRQKALGTESQIRIFKSHCGRHPLHLSRVHRDLQVAGILSEIDAREKHVFFSFLLANNFLRCCEEDDLRCTRFNVPFNDLTERTWLMIDMLYQLKQWKISCPPVWPAKLGATVDGTTQLSLAAKQKGDFDIAARITQLVELDEYTNELRLKDASNTTFSMLALKNKFPHLSQGDVVRVRSCFFDDTSAKKILYLSHFSNIMTFCACSKFA